MDEPIASAPKYRALLDAADGVFYSTSSSGTTPNNTAITHAPTVAASQPWSILLGLDGIGIADNTDIARMFGLITLPRMPS
jgi:hypothetical protein